LTLDDPKYSPQNLTTCCGCGTLVASVPSDAAGQKHYVLSHRSKAKVSTGVKMVIPAGWKVCISILSSLADKGLICSDAPAHFGSDHTDKISVNVLNVGREIVEIKDGDPVANFWLEQVHPFEFVEEKNEG
jgi:dUTP pyrophosphatase